MTRGSDSTWLGVPPAITLPCSRATNSSHSDASRPMSCSMMIIEQPVSAWTRRSSGPSASVSRWATPAEGSSKSTTAGSCASRHASSTIRRMPVDSSPVGRSA